MNSKKLDYKLTGRKTSITNMLFIVAVLVLLIIGGSAILAIIDRYDKGIGLRLAYADIMYGTDYSIRGSTDGNNNGGTVICPDGSTHENYLLEFLGKRISGNEYNQYYYGHWFIIKSQDPYDYSGDNNYNTLLTAKNGKILDYKINKTAETFRINGTEVHDETCNTNTIQSSTNVTIEGRCNTGGSLVTFNSTNEENGTFISNVACHFPRLIVNITVTSENNGSRKNPALINGITHTNNTAVILVSIIGEQEFNVSHVNASTVSFQGAQPIDSAKGKIMDVNGDGINDLVFQFARQNINVSAGDTQLCLKGDLKDGTPFRGCTLAEIKGK